MRATFRAALLELFQQLSKSVGYALIDHIVVNCSELLTYLRLNFASEARFLFSCRGYIH
jgi:hypothetical protein